MLRHPNLIKFLSSYAYDDSIYLLTELVSPLEIVIKSLGYEEMIKGLRDIARGLQFIHETVSPLYIADINPYFRISVGFFFLKKNYQASLSTRMSAGRGVGALPSWFTYKIILSKYNGLHLALK